MNRVKIQEGKMKDRRKFPRYNCLIELKYKTIDGKEAGYCFTEDLSQGGLAMPLQKYITPHKKVIVELDLPDGRGSVTAQATIVWCKKNKLPWEPLYSAGVKFNKIDLGSTKELANFASRHQWQKSDFEKELEKNEIPLVE